MLKKLIIEGILISVFSLVTVSAMSKLSCFFLFHSSACLCVNVFVIFRAVSTFWIANPNNHLIGNAAAGSQVITQAKQPPSDS